MQRQTKPAVLPKAPPVSRRTPSPKWILLPSKQKTQNRCLYSPNQPPIPCETSLRHPQPSQTRRSTTPPAEQHTPPIPKRHRLYHRNCRNRKNPRRKRQTQSRLCHPHLQPQLLFRRQRPAGRSPKRKPRSTLRTLRRPPQKRHGQPGKSTGQNARNNATQRPL